MRIAQISDSHISLDHPARTADLERCIEQVNALDPRPDVVVHTGDIAHNGLAQEYDVARSLLDRLHAPCVVLAGNRDDRRALIDAFADAGYLRPEFPFVQYGVEHFPVRLICVDTVSETSNKGRLCRDRLADLDRMLSADRARPAALFLHHPPMSVDVAPDPVQYEDPGDVGAVLALLAQHDHVHALFCGHVHRDVEGRAGAVPIQVMSCGAIDLRKGEKEPAGALTPLFKLRDLACANQAARAATLVR